MKFTNRMKMNIVRKSNVLMLVTYICVLISCTNNRNIEREFWEVDNSFEPDSTWKTYSYAGAFTIQVPSYMRENFGEMNIDDEKWLKSADNPFCYDKCTLSEKPLQTGESAFTSFNSRKDSLHKGYAYLKILYLKGKRGDYLQHMQMANVYDKQSEAFCNSLIKWQLGSGKLLKVRTRDMDFTSNYNAMLDICYQRVGITEREGPVTVHIFILQNLDEAVMLVASYHDKDKNMFKGLFNVVETLKWNEEKYARINN